MNPKSKRRTGFAKFFAMATIALFVIIQALSGPMIALAETYTFTQSD